MERGRKRTSAVNTACLSAGSASICAWESVITVLMSSCISYISIFLLYSVSPEPRIQNLVGGRNALVDQAGMPAQTQGEVPVPLEVVEPRQNTCSPVGLSEDRACSRRRGKQMRVLMSCTMNWVYWSRLS